MTVSGGTLNWSATGEVALSGLWTVDSGATLDYVTAPTVPLTGAIANSGIVNLSQPMTLEGNITNSGTMTFSAAVILQGGGITNTGTISFPSGTTTLQGGYNYNATGGVTNVNGGTANFSGSGAVTMRK